MGKNPPANAGDMGSIYVKGIEPQLIIHGSMCANTSAGHPRNWQQELSQNIYKCWSRILWAAGGAHRAARKSKTPAVSLSALRWVVTGEQWDLL